MWLANGTQIALAPEQFQSLGGTGLTGFSLFFHSCKVSIAFKRTAFLRKIDGLLKNKPGIVCLFSFPQLLCFKSSHVTLWAKHEPEIPGIRLPTSNPSLKKPWISAFLRSVSAFSLLLRWCHCSVWWITDGYQHLFPWDTFRSIPGTSKLCYFSQHSRGSDVAQIKSCPPDLCVFWPKMELHISMAGMCWMLWIRLLRRAAPRILLLNYISAIKHSPMLLF